MGLFPVDQTTGGYVEVLALPTDGPRDLLLDAVLCVHGGDVHKCLRAILSGKELMFTLMAPAKPDADSFVQLPPKSALSFRLPNDLGFKQRYDEICGQIEQSQDATRARHLREGWYRRRPDLFK
jgi:hypothetical protein